MRCNLPQSPSRFPSPQTNWGSPPVPVPPPHTPRRGVGELGNWGTGFTGGFAEEDFPQSKARTGERKEAGQ